MFEKLGAFLGRKLIGAILAPLLSALFLALNNLLLAKIGTALTDEQVTTIIQWILGVVGTAIAGQGVADTVSAKQGTYRLDGSVETKSNISTVVPTDPMANI